MTGKSVKVDGYFVKSGETYFLSEDSVKINHCYPSSYWIELIGEFEKVEFNERVIVSGGFDLNISGLYRKLKVSSCEKFRRIETI